MGTSYVYETLLRPFLSKHETDIGKNLQELRYRASDVAILLPSYELAMAADEVPDVGGHETRKVSISFSRLLHQVVEYLKLPVPAYYLVDVGKNAVKVVMETDPGLGPTVYEGGQATTVRESREKAAENVVRSLQMEFNVPKKWLTVSDHKRRKKYVCIDYMDVLHTLSSVTKVHVSKVNTFTIGPGKFVSWVTIYGSSVATGVECFFSAVRADLKATKQDVAKKDVDFIRTSHNLDIVDLNYGNEIYADIKCSLARESYLAPKERCWGFRVLFN
uniref:Uncharacterized protein n=1 Tax=Chenopodium quinoa TaxID=63459 RepID=A0A803MNZ8_CHEQI